MSTTASASCKVALIGMGRMGQALDALANSRGCEIVARIGKADAASGITREMLKGANVAIEFSIPASVVANAEACVKANCAVVIGTTGWNERRAQFDAFVTQHNGRALFAPNYSLGVQLFLSFVHDAAVRLKHLEGLGAGFDAHVVETHHAAKKDAPSGTGLAVVEQLTTALNRDVPVTSIRTGSVPGTHEVIFDGAFEQIRLIHEARDRRVFADGALLAAKWLSVQNRPGFYSMRDVLEHSTTQVSS